jgi:hypothetical protein
MHKKLQLENLKGRDNLGDQGINGKLVLKWFLTFLG